jgi:hypothetical protein
MGEIMEVSDPVGFNVSMVKRLHDYTASYSE